MSAFFALHQDLPREGPGNDASTLEALKRLSPLPPHPRVLDLGCGPGQQTLVLARALQTKIVAVDTHQPFLDQLNRSAAEAGLAGFIETRCTDMGALDVAEGSIDLIWSEGAAYILGFGEALRRWSRLLVPGGCLAVTELSWLTEHRPAVALEFWGRHYPPMISVSENVRTAEAVGLEVFDTFPLPAIAWWEQYYGPMEERIAYLRPNADAELKIVLDGGDEEIDMYRRFGDSYGYVFYLLRKPVVR